MGNNEINDEMILDFLMKNSYQNKIDGTYLIYGKNCK